MTCGAPSVVFDIRSYGPDWTQVALGAFCFLASCRSLSLTLRGKIKSRRSHQELTGVLAIGLSLAITAILIAASLHDYRTLTFGLESGSADITVGRASDVRFPLLRLGSSALMRVDGKALRGPKSSSLSIAAHRAFRAADGKIVRALSFDGVIVRLEICGRQPGT
jgi:hypothetical protein